MEKGSETSHNSIIARSFDLTCIVGIPELFANIENNDLIILDGNEGKIIINPEPSILNQYRDKLQILNEHKEDLLSLIEITPEKILGKKNKLRNQY